MQLSAEFSCDDIEWTRLKIYAFTLSSSRSEFIENLLAAFERDHPDFTAHLKECGLDEEEIRFCCLEVLGVRDEN